MSLERFHQAQAGAFGGYSTALAEIRAGSKRSHWIWYIFPQMEGLGRSSTAQKFALRGLEEAFTYLRDPILRSRYEEISEAVETQLARGIPVETLMGSEIDACKLASSLTLFRAAASQLAAEDAGLKVLGRRCDAILNVIAPQGFPPCTLTLEKLTAGA